MEKPSIGIIGAGPAGLACATRLQCAGFRPIIYEKSRGIGGRVASRRLDAAASIDHGAQYVTARSERFKKMLNHFEQEGVIQTWAPHIFGSGASPEAMFVGAPRMNAFLKPWSGRLRLLQNQKVTKLAKLGPRWRICTESGSHDDEFDVVVCTAPAPQAEPLCSDASEIVASLSFVSFDPCWSVLLAFKESPFSKYDVYSSPSNDIDWICRDNSKPGRAENPSTWTILFTAEWGRRNLESDNAAVERHALDCFKRVVGTTESQTLYVSAHRWRFARPTAWLDRPFVNNSDYSLFAAGDWCLGADVESAFLSGFETADAIIKAYG